MREILDQSANNKRIAKNVSILYIRMFITMLVGLYTSRVILNNLGITDYGIYNVVGGVVAMFSFINGSIGTATTRFLTYELGKDQSYEKLRIVFSTSLIIHFGISLLVFILGETVGLWYIYNILVVPSQRFTAALVVYQFSLITSIIGIISVPYNAALVAHEKMSTFAYISIFEICANLVIAISLSYINYDRLIVYAFLLLLIQIFLRIIYAYYCSTHFIETTGKWLFDKIKFREMLKFSVWIMNGAIAVVGYTQGLNMLLNVFFGPAINAARGIAVSVQTKVFQFCTNSQIAVNPQIIKQYANGNFEYMHSLINSTSRYSFLLIYILSFPILLKPEYILKIWLGIVPNYTVVFVQLTLMVGLIDSLRMPLNTAIHATGNIKKFQLLEGGISLLILPLAFLFLKLGFSPISVFIVQAVMFVIIHIVRVLIVCPVIKMKLSTYLVDVVWGIIKVVIPASVIPLVARILIKGDGFFPFFYVCVLSIISSLFFVYFLGLDQGMKNKVKTVIPKYILFRKS